MFRTVLIKRYYLRSTRNNFQQGFHQSSGCPPAWDFVLLRILGFPWKAFSRDVSLARVMPFPYIFKDAA